MLLKIVGASADLWFSRQTAATGDVIHKPSSRHYILRYCHYHHHNHFTALFPGPPEAECESTEG